MAYQDTLGKISSLKQSVSARKADANRQNALKSTGPKTPRGKTNSRRNALKHGLFAKDLSTDFMVQKENPQEFYELVDRLRREHKPVGTAEELEVERIGVCWWRLQRAWRYENAEILFGLRDVFVRGSNIPKIMNPEDETLILLLGSAEKEIEANGEISSELREKMFATSPSFREQWAQLEETVTQKYEERVGELAREAGMSLPVVRSLRRDPNSQAERASVIALATTKSATRSIESRAEQISESVLNVAYDRQAIPNRDALDKILRYESAIERDLNRALDRLERLQRRRKGELIPPPLNLHVTREI